MTDVLSIEPQENNGELSIAPDSGSQLPSYTQEGAKSKAERVRFSMGPEDERFFDPQSVLSTLQTSSEQDLQQVFSTMETLKQNQRRMDVLQAFAASKKELGGTVTDQEREMIRNLSKEELVDPGTVLEKKFAEKYTNFVLSQQSDWAKAQDADTEKADQIANQFQDLIFKQEVIRTMLEKADKNVSDQSWAGWGVDFAKGFIPLYNTYKTRALAPNAPTSPLLAGSNVEEQGAYLMSISDPKRFKSELSAAYEKLAEDNPQLAREWLENILGQTTMSRNLDNIFTVLDAASIAGAIKGAPRAIKALPDLAEGASARLRASLRGLAENMGRKKVDEIDTITAVGNQIDAVSIQASRAMNLKEAVEKTGTNDTTLLSRLVQTVGAKIFDPSAPFEGVQFSRLNNAWVSRLVEMMSSNNQRMARILSDVNKVARLDEGSDAMRQAFDNAVEYVKDFYGPSVRSAVIDAETKHVFSTDTLANVSRVEVAIGRPDGSLFDTETGLHSAMKFYGIDENAYEVKLAGNKFYASVSKDVDETGVKDVFLDTSTKTNINPWGRVMNWIRSSDNLVSPSNKTARKTATYSSEEISRLYSDMAKPIASLNSKEKKRLTRLLEQNRDMPHPVTGDRGYYFKDVNEFDQAFIQMHGHAPNPQETMAYFASKQLNDFDYVLRNLNLYRDRASRGWEDFTFKFGGKETNKIKGKLLNDLPWDVAEDARILVVDPDGTPRIKYMKQMSPAERSLMENAIKNKNRRVVHITQPLLRDIEESLPDALKSSDPINYVVSSSPKRFALGYEQIPYKEGGHVVNDYRYFVKNANVIGGPGNQSYIGDLTFSGHNTEREAQEFARDLEEARQIYRKELAAGKTNRNTKELDDFVNSHFPFTPNEYRQMHHKKLLNADGPIVVLKDGVRYSDVADIRSQGLKDQTKSLHNLEDTLDKAFTSEKGEQLYTFKKGTAGNPAWKMEIGKTLNPIDSLNQGLRSAIRSRLYTDYVVKSANEFIEQFSDLMVQSKETMRRNPIYWLYHPQWKDRLYSSSAMETVVTETRKTVPGRARKDWSAMYEDGNSILGGSANTHYDDPDFFERSSVRYKNVQDPFGVRRYGDKVLPVPDWFKEADNLVKELSSRLDIPNVKLWFGEGDGKSGGIFTQSDRINGKRYLSIVIPTNLNHSKLQILRTVAHEMGHAVDFATIKTAPKATRDALDKAWNTWISNKVIKQDITDSELFPGILNSNTPISVLIKTHPQYAAYLINRAEWFAEETAKWLLTRKQPMNVVERFFEGLAQKWKEIYEAVLKPKKDVNVNRAVASFLRGQWREDKEIVTRQFSTVLTNALGSDESLERLAAAKSMRDAVISLVSTPTPIKAAWESVRNRALNFVYDKWGSDGAAWVDDMAVFKTRDPVRFARSIAFHSKIGLFNPVQFFVNSASLVHAFAISPQHAFGGFKDAMLMFYARRNPSVEIQNWLRKKSGYRHWDELNTELKRSGFGNVGRNVADLDDFLGENAISGKFGRFLDAGTIWFRSSEEMVRLNAFAIAHREWRKKNPTAPITDAIRRELTDRADNLSVNMSRASSAWYNRGIMSIPAQFTSYNMRLAEQITHGIVSGKGALTRAEAAKAMLGYSLLYGIPTGAGAAVGFWPVQQSFEEAAIKYGVDLEANVFVNALSRGIATVISDAVVGAKSNVPERYGPNGLSIIKDVVNGDKTMVDFFVGASGSIIWQGLEASYPLLKAMSQAITGGEDFPLVHDDFLDAARNISTIDNATKMYMAINWGQYITKNEVVMTDVKGIQSIILGLTGLTPREAVDTYLGKKVIKDMAKEQENVTKLVVKEFHRAFRAIQDGKFEDSERYFKRAQTYIAGADLNLQGKNAIFTRALGEYGEQADDVNFKLLMKAQNEDVFNRRLEKEKRK